MQYLILAFVITPIVELYLLIKIGVLIGAFNTIMLVVLTGIAGALLARSQGLAVLNKINSDRVAQSQGMFRFKKNQLEARIFFFKLFGKKIPIYNQKLLQSKFSDYLMATWLYFWLSISSKRYLWSLFTIKRWITKWISNFRSTDIMET